MQYKDTILYTNILTELKYFEADGCCKTCHFAISSRRQDPLFLPSMLLGSSGNNASSISHESLLKNNDSRIKTSIS